MFFLTSVVSDKILRVSIKEPLLISNKLIVLLHTLSGYNSLHFRCKVYSSDPRECLYTTWRYAEAYENFSIEPALCQKNPIKNHYIKLSSFNTRGKLHSNKCVTDKVCLVWSLILRQLYSNKSIAANVSLKNLVRKVLNENNLWNSTFKSVFW